MHFLSEYQQKSAWNLSNCIDIHIEESKESSFKNRYAISESKKKKKGSAFNHYQILIII